MVEKRDGPPFRVTPKPDRVRAATVHRACPRPIQEWKRDGYYFVVYELSMKFKRPGRLGDLLQVVSSFGLDSVYRGRFSQRLECRGKLLVEAAVDVVCIDAQQQLREFPAL